MWLHVFSLFFVNPWLQQFGVFSSLESFSEFTTATHPRDISKRNTHLPSDRYLCPQILLSTIAPPISREMHFSQLAAMPKGLFAGMTSMEKL